MDITTFALSERGSRDYNEDAHGDAELMAGRCVIVADGAGGHRGGGVASKLVVESALLYLASAPIFKSETLVSAIDAATSALHRRQLDEPPLREMSSTVALLCVDALSGTARWAHLGDSRLLVFRAGRVRQLTRDHSVVQSLADAGMLSKGIASSKVDRTALYAAVGAEGDTRPVAGEPIQPRNGDAFLLCTDGAWDSVSPGRMSALLRRARTVQQWVTQIGEAVVQAGKANQDNYTVVGLWVGSPDAAGTLPT